VIALEAAFGAGPGVIAIAGTGSIVYGRDAGGSHRTRRRLGVRGLRRRLRPLDRPPRHLRHPERAIKAAKPRSPPWFSKPGRLNTIDELVQQANSTPPPDFPRLFPIVLRAADGRPMPSPATCLAEAGAKLAGLAAIVIRRLAPHAAVDALPVAMTGSVFRQSPYVRQVFYNTLQTEFRRHRSASGPGRSRGRSAGQSTAMSVETGLAPFNAG
jgi:glucosamine kinase